MALDGLDEILKSESDFKYQLLDRLKQDCEYFLGWGDRDEKRLWALNPQDQISYMKAIWDHFPENQKPEWLSMEDILKYEKEMCV